MKQSEMISSTMIHPYPHLWLSIPNVAYLESKASATEEHCLDIIVYVIERTFLLLEVAVLNLAVNVNILLIVSTGPRHSLGNIVGIVSGPLGAYRVSISTDLNEKISSKLIRCNS